MKEELTRLPDGRFETHNGEILPSARTSRAVFKRLQCEFNDGSAVLLISAAYSDAIRRAFARSEVDEWGHWQSDLHTNHVNGYSQIWVGGDVKLTKGLHVVSYLVFVGEITAGNHIDHLCRNRRCWYPEHLKQKTPRDNTRAGVLARRHRLQPPLFLV